MPNLSLQAMVLFNFGGSGRTRFNQVQDIWTTDFLNVETASHENRRNSAHLFATEQLFKARESNAVVEMLN